MRIFLDVDDVLADFTGAACRLHGVSRADLESARVPGTWSIVETLAQIRQQPMTQEDFWHPIHVQGAEFWANLEILPWMDALVKTVRAATDDWHLVTAPSTCSTSYNGKIRWIRRHFGSQFDRFSIHPHKHLYAQPGSVLIDDRESTVERFRQHGGVGIVFPSTGNSLYSEAANPVSYVRRQLEIQKCI